MLPPPLGRPDFPRTFLGLARSLRLLGQLGDARHAALQGLELAPEDDALQRLARGRRVGGAIGRGAVGEAFTAPNPGKDLEGCGGEPGRVGRGGGEGGGKKPGLLAEARLFLCFLMEVDPVLGGLQELLLRYFLGVGVQENRGGSLALTQAHIW